MGFIINPYRFSVVSRIQALTATEAFASIFTNSFSRSMNIGSGFSQREIWLAICAMEGDSIHNSVDVTSVTIGGNSATQVFEQLGVNGVGANISISYWKYQDNGVLGTSATVAGNVNLNAAHIGVIVFTTNPSTLFDSYGATSSTGNPTAGTIDTTSTGWSFYCACSQNSASGTVSGFTNGTPFDMGSNEWITWGYNSPEDNGTVNVPQPSNGGTASETITGISVSGS